MVDLARDRLAIQELGEAAADARFWKTLNDGNKALEGKKTAEAESLYESALEQRPDSLEAMQGLAGAYLGGGKAAQAKGAAAAEGAGERPRAGADAAAIGRSRRFREETRDERIEIAREAEHTFGRKLSWGVVCDNYKVMFTTLSIPVMTRLRQSERRVLDTLVDAGVARSRSDALAWCVKLVGEHEDSWLSDLREALRHVEQVRAEGPRA